MPPRSWRTPSNAPGRPPDTLMRRRPRCCAGSPRSPGLWRTTLCAHATRGVPTPQGIDSFPGVIRPAPLLLLATIAAPVHSQTRASLGIGIGSVRYEGGTAFSSAAFSPALEYASPALTADVSG